MQAVLLTPWFPANSSCSLRFFLFMVESKVKNTTSNMGSFQVDVRGIDMVWTQVLWIKGNQRIPWIEKTVLIMVRCNFMCISTLPFLQKRKFFYSSRN